MVRVPTGTHRRRSLRLWITLKLRLRVAAIGRIYAGHGVEGAVATYPQEPGAAVDSCPQIRLFTPVDNNVDGEVVALLTCEYRSGFCRRGDQSTQCRG